MRISQIIFPIAFILLFASACGSVSGDDPDTKQLDLGGNDVAVDAGQPDGDEPIDSALPDAPDETQNPPDLGESDEGADTADAADTADTAAADAADVSDVEEPNCSGDTPVECDNILENGEPTCYPEDTDCNTIQLDASGGLVWCKIGDEPHINDDGLLQCCGGNKPVWCESVGTIPGYPGWCHPEDTDCSTLKQCGSGVPEACEVGYQSFCRGDGKVDCCGGDTPFWCPPVDESVGFCRPESANCNNAVSCDGGETWGVCSFGIATNCSTDGHLFCCKNETPRWCAPGSGANPGFPGRCFSLDTDCDQVGPGPNDTWISCSLSEIASIDVYGNLVCCGADTPVQCANYAGLDATYDGSQCFPEGTNCDSLFMNPQPGVWDFCLEGKQYGVAANNALVCCGDVNPNYCPAGTPVADGDAAFNFAVSEISPTNECEESCSIDANCFGSVPPLKCKALPGEPFEDENESGFFEEGEEFSDSNANGVYDAAACNQCIANASSFTFPYIGGCWAPGSLCSRIHYCGGVFKQCDASSCFCWNGVLYENW